MKLSKLLIVLSLGILAGCAGRAEVWPNKDPALRKTAAEFAADAAKRHPYKATAPRGGDAMAGCEVGYVWDRLDISNFSESDWTDVELWINGEYVLFLPKLESKQLKSIPFQALYDDKGQSFPTGNGKWTARTPVIISKVELYRDGKLYDVKVRNPE